MASRHDHEPRPEPNEHRAAGGIEGADFDAERFRQERRIGHLTVWAALLVLVVCWDAAARLDGSASEPDSASPVTVAAAPGLATRVAAPR